MGHQHIRRDCKISSLLLGSGTDRDRRSGPPTKGLRIAQKFGELHHAVEVNTQLGLGLSTQLGLVGGLSTQLGLVGERTAGELEELAD